MQKILQSKWVTNFLKFYTSAEVEITSVAVGYYLLISLLPILMTLGYILPYLQLDTTDFLNVIEEFLPSQVFSRISPIIVAVFTRPSSGWLSVSILTTAWTFSRSLSALQKGFNKAYGLRRHRDFIISRIISLFSSFMLELVLVIIVLVATFGKSVLTLLYNYTHFNDQLYQYLMDFTQPVTFVALFLVLLVLYMILPNVKVGRIRYVLPGTIYVIFIVTFVSNIFAHYAATYAERLMTFQMASYVVIVIIMLWFTFISRILIVGAVLNATYQSLHEETFKTRRGTVAEVISRYKR